jgi:CelD/BcsL family acetyltransferase involved in cellulose biosynthesis
MPASVFVQPVPWCRVVTDPAEAERLRPAWSALAARSFRNELTQSPDWLLTWWQVYGPLQGRQLRLGFFYQGDRLVGLAPLLRRRHWYRGVVPYRRLEFLASGEPAEQGIYSNHLSVLAEAGAEESVARSMVEAAREGAFGAWDEVVLPMMSADTPMPGLLAGAFRAAGFAVDMKEIARAPYISLPTTWDAYLRSLSANARRNVRRSLKALDACSAGATRLESVQHVADLEMGKSILTKLHHQRWESAGQTGVFRFSSYLRFHDAVMRRLLARGSLQLTWLCVGHEPVAALYGMEWSGKVYLYQLGRRIDVAERLRPGATLLALMIRKAIEAGHREFDLLADDAPFKRHLAPQARALLRLRVAPPSLVESLRRAGKGCLASLRWLRRPAD